MVFSKMHIQGKILIVQIARFDMFGSTWFGGASHHNETPRNRFLILFIGKMWNDTSMSIFRLHLYTLQQHSKKPLQRRRKIWFFCVLTEDNWKPLNLFFPTWSIPGASLWWLAPAYEPSAPKHIEPGLFHTFILKLSFGSTTT